MLHVIWFRQPFPVITFMHPSYIRVDMSIIELFLP
jgi:hypothetical protein